MAYRRPNGAHAITSIERDLERLNMVGMAPPSVDPARLSAYTSREISNHPQMIPQIQPQSRRQGGSDATSAVDAINADLAKLSSGDPLDLLTHDSNDAGSAPRDDCVRALRERSQSPGGADPAPPQPQFYASASPSIESAYGMSHWGDRSRMALQQAPPMRPPYYASPSSYSASEFSPPPKPDETSPPMGQYAGSYDAMRPPRPSPGRNPPARLLPASATGVEPMTMEALKNNLAAHSALQTEIDIAIKEAREAWLAVSSVERFPPTLSVVEKVHIRHTEAEREAWESWPPYCCVILKGEGHREGQIFVEQRGGDAKVAPKKMTCFGGKREQGELPGECIRRECHEELQWVPRGDMVRVCDFYVDGELIAWFYESQGPKEDDEIVFEPGRQGVWVDPNDDRISPWHAAALEARQNNLPRADFWKAKKPEAGASPEGAAEEASSRRCPVWLVAPCLPIAARFCKSGTGGDSCSEGDPCRWAL